MKIYVIFLFSILTAVAGRSQQSSIQVLRSDELQGIIEVTEQMGLLNIRMIHTIPGNLGRITGIRLQDADLRIDYELDGLQEKSFFYDVQFSIRPSGDRPIRIPAGELLGNYGPQQPLPDDALHIIWTDATEQGLLYGEQYELTLAVDLRGDPGVDCSGARPEFGFREQWPHYLGAVVGAGLIAAGQIYDDQAHQDYENYENLWRNGASAQQADHLPGEADNQHNTFEKLTYAGIGILALDAAWMAYRAIRIKKDQQKYDRYCPSSNLTFSPKIDLFNSVEGPSLGWKMAWRF